MASILLETKWRIVFRGEVSEDEAAGFYEQAYRQAYLRLFVLVSSLYQQHSGKDSYFWEAQRLTLHDCNAADLKQAFVDIVSGIEDLRDAQATLDFVQESTDKAVVARQMIALARNRETLGSMVA